MHRPAKLSFFTLLLAAAAFAQTAPARQTLAEKQTELWLEKARKTPLALRGFLLNMPKGADLHSHLSGAVYAESFIRAAVEDGLCVDPATNSFARPQSMTDSSPPQPVCGEGKVPAARR